MTHSEITSRPLEKIKIGNIMLKVSLRSAPGLCMDGKHRLKPSIRSMRRDHGSRIDTAPVYGRPPGRDRRKGAAARRRNGVLIDQGRPRRHDATSAASADRMKRGSRYAV